MTNQPSASIRQSGSQRESTTAVLLFLGYSLYKMVMLDSYLTDFGVFHESLGYVSNITFMEGASAGIIVTSIVLFLLRAHDTRPFVLPYRSPLLSMLVCYMLGAVVDPTTWSLVLFGLGWGVTTTLITVVFAELFSQEESSVTIILQLAFAAFFSAVLILALENVPQMTKLLVCLLSVCTCWLTIRNCRATFVAQVEQTPAPTKSDFKENEQQDDGNTVGCSGFKAALKQTSMPIIAYVFFELVVGCINMFAYAGGSSFVIASSAPMWGMLICAGLLVAIVVLSNRAPNLGLVNLVAFPIAIAVLLLLPFLGEDMGEQLSVLIYAAYIFTTTLSMFCYVTACRDSQADVCRMSALVHLLARLMLTVGLTLGYAFGRLPGSEPVMRSGIVVATCAYLLLAVIVYGSFRASRQKQVKIVVRQVTESFEEASRAKIETMARKYALSGREQDVYLSLLRGGSAKSIAEELGLSPYTVQGYVQGLYAKLGVNKKDQAIQLFYQENRSPEKSNEVE